MTWQYSARCTALQSFCCTLHTGVCWTLNRGVCQFWMARLATFPLTLCPSPLPPHALLRLPSLRSVALILPETPTMWRRRSECEIAGPSEQIFAQTVWVKSELTCVWLSKSLSSGTQICKKNWFMTKLRIWNKRGMLHAYIFKLSLFSDIPLIN